MIYGSVCVGGCGGDGGSTVGVGSSSDGVCDGSGGDGGRDEAVNTTRDDSHYSAILANDSLHTVTAVPVVFTIEMELPQPVVPVQPFDSWRC